MMLLAPALPYKEANEQIQVAHNDERWRQDGFGLVLDHQAVALELPDLVRDGVYLVERVAASETIIRVC